MTPIELKGSVKYTTQGKLVAEVSCNDTRTLCVGKSIITVAGVTGRVQKIGERFGIRQYVYLAEASGDVPVVPVYTKSVSSVRPAGISRQDWNDDNDIF
jgi:hypothetical protein